MARAGIQMNLGGFIFSLDKAGYEKLDRSTGYRWPAQPRIQRSVAHQFVGRDEESVTISGYIHPEFRGKMYQLDQLRAIAEEGKPKMLVSGTGKVLGKYCIVKVDDNFSGVMDDHRARRVDFTVELKKYGDDGER